MGIFTKITFLNIVLFGFTTNVSAQVFFTENFEAVNSGKDLPALWTESGHSSDGNWSTDNAANASSGFWATNPTLEGTQFAFTNDDECDCDKSADRIILPSQSFAGMEAIYLTTDVLFNNRYGGTFLCQASTDGGATWTTEHTYANTGAAWTNDVLVDLSRYAGLSDVLISFIYNDAGTWAYGAGIDDVKLTDLTNDNMIVEDNYTASAVANLSELEASWNVNIYPNPANATATITFDTDELDEIYVIDMTGKILINQSVNNSAGSLELNTEHLAPGVYSIRLVAKSSGSIRLLSIAR